MNAWFENPQSLVPGAIEPRHAFSGGEKSDLTAYLLTLKQNPTSEKAAHSSEREGQR